MSTTESHTTLPRHDGGSFDLITATSGKRGPGIVFVCSAYGVNADLRATMARYAEHGFVCAAPDMFSRHEFSGPLEMTDENRPKARGRLQDYPFDSGMSDIKSVMDSLRARNDCTGTVAVAGYCFGGEFAYLATLQAGAAAGVTFHGVGIGKHLDVAKDIKVPLSLHFGAADPLVPHDEVAAIETAFEGRPDVEVFEYAGAKHGFSQPESPAYDPSAAATSEAHALAMLAKLR